MSDTSEDISLVLPSSQELKKVGNEENKKAQSSRDSSREKNDKESEENDSYKSPSKIRRSGGPMSVDESEKEYKYRRKYFSDVDEVVSSRKLRCTACNCSLQSVVSEGRDVYHHPILKVLMCKSCIGFYGDGNFPIDEDGSDKYCRWCGQGGTLYCCAECCCAFCKQCIKRNLQRSILVDIESEDWKCFVCDGKPLWELRAICANAEQFSKKIRRAKRDENERNLKKLQKTRSPMGKKSRRLNRWQKASSGSSNDDSDSVPKRNLPSMKKRKRSNSSPLGSDDGKNDKKQKLKGSGSDSDVIEMKKEEIVVTISDSEEDKKGRRQDNSSEDTEEESSDSSYKRQQRRKRKKKNDKNKSNGKQETEDNKSKSSEKSSLSENGDKSTGNIEVTNQDDDLDKEMPNEVSSSSAKSACDWLNEHFTELSKLGELLTYQSQKVSKRKVREELMTNPQHVRKVINSFKTLVKVAKDNMEHVDGFLTLHHKYWMKRVIRKHKSKTGTRDKAEGKEKASKQETKNKNDEENEECGEKMDVSENRVSDDDVEMHTGDKSKRGTRDKAEGEEKASRQRPESKTDVENEECGEKIDVPENRISDDDIEMHTNTNKSDVDVIQNGFEKDDSSETDEAKQTADRKEEEAENDRKQNEIGEEEEEKLENCDGVQDEDFIKENGGNCRTVLDLIDEDNCCEEVRHKDTEVPEHESDEHQNFKNVEIEETKTKKSKKRKLLKDSDDEEKEIIKSSESEGGVKKKVLKDKKRVKFDVTTDNEENDLVLPELLTDNGTENSVVDNDQTNTDSENNILGLKNSVQNEEKVPEDEGTIKDNSDNVHELSGEKCRTLKGKKDENNVVESDSSVEDMFGGSNNESTVSFESLATLVVDKSKEPVLENALSDKTVLPLEETLQISEVDNTEDKEKGEVTNKLENEDKTEKRNEEREEKVVTESDTDTVELLFNNELVENDDDDTAMKEGSDKENIDLSCTTEEQLETNDEKGSGKNSDVESMEQDHSEDLLQKCVENSSAVGAQEHVAEVEKDDGQLDKKEESAENDKESDESDNDGGGDSDIGNLQITDDEMSDSSEKRNDENKVPICEDKSDKTDEQICEDVEQSDKEDEAEESVSKYTEEAIEAQKALLGYTSDDEEDGDSQTDTPKKKKKEGSKRVKKNSNSGDKNAEEKTVKKRRPGPKSRTYVGIESTDSELPSSEEDSSSSSDKQIMKAVGLKKKKRFRLKDTEAYKQDEKLGWKCSVVVERLPEDVFQKYYEQYYSEEEDESEKAIKDDKEIHSLVNLKSLKKARGKKSDGDATESDASDDNDNGEKKKKVKTKKDKKKEEEQKLIDFFKTIDDDEDEEVLLSSDASGSEKEVVKAIKMKKSLIDKKNEMAMKMLLGSSSEDDSDGGSEKEDETGKEKKPKKIKIKKEKEDEDSKKEEDEEGKEEGEGKEEDDEKEEEKKKKNEDSDDNSNDDFSDDSKKSKKKRDWRKDKLLTEKLSDRDTSDEERLWKAKKDRELKDDNIDSEEKMNTKEKTRKKKARRRIFGSDDDNSDVATSSSDNSSSDDFVTPKKKKRQAKKSDSDESKSSDSDAVSAKKVKRKRIRAPASDSSSDDDEDRKDASQKSETPGKGRKNIHRIMKDENVGEATRRAAREEEERKKRILEKQKMYNEIYKQMEGEEKIDKLVLDFEPETKEELVSVDPHIASKLKPHQVKGVKFMWDACFESLKQIQKTKGSGCILAHCMGLGKTFQVVTLVHTLLNHKETKVKTVLVVCPLSTVLNWVNEFNMWLKEIGEQVNVFELSKYKQNYERMYQLKDWQEEGGVMVLGYDMYRNLTNTQTKRLRKKAIETFQSTLVDPGPDLVVCDEGHLLKNEDTALAKAMRRIRTLRRIVLTGTPLQNNLKEYHCMVQFVKPNLLGTRKEFLNRFVNPITNGQFEDSTTHDVKIMKRRAHVLHKMLEGSVQRFDYSVLTPFLPPKYEYVISIPLSEVQIKAYRHYLEHMSMGRYGDKPKGAALFADFQNLQRIWTHPRVLMMNTEKAEKTAERKRLMESDSEGSLRDFIADDSSESSSSSSSSSSENSDSDVQVVKEGEENKKANKFTRNTRSKGPAEDPEIMEIDKKEDDKPNPLEWWKQFIESDELENINYSGKLVLLFYILRECEKIGDKVLVFSQSLYSLDLIEYFLSCIDNSTQNGETKESLGNNTGSWAMGLDYFRLDGSTSSENRSLWCKAFNREDNLRARLFIISTRAGGLGINLFAANRVIIFDASWNPSHDVQSIFRIYRFGQKKPCYIYRFLAQGTMEEKIYDRQVTKLSLSCRVVDEQQIERHYNMADLQELYQFDPEQKTKRPTPILPKDRLLAEMLKEHEQWIVTYHEHDSLLENKEEEELNEEERQAAWEEYENEKKGKVIPPAIIGQQPTLNMPALREALRKENPLATDDQLESHLSLVITQIYEYLNSQQKQNEMAAPNYQYTSAQLQALQQYRLQQEQMLRVQQEKFRQQQEAMRAAAANNVANYPNMQNLTFQQYLQDQNANKNSSAYPANLYRNVAVDKSNLLRMHSKIVPFAAQPASSSKIMNYGGTDTGDSQLISRHPVILPASRASTSMVKPPYSHPTVITENPRKDLTKPTENKKPVPDDVIETID
ncbi:transcriptional regulator ATRX-like isoform X2 [Periplaneta americana]|uniref:transcriptional regulator ATRX-like isoform X2 n=1 Tax=Periplaneta americana TaxID=6978 RepID=UPI0037E9379A